MTWLRSLGWENPLEKGMVTHSSTLAWTIPWTGEPGGLQSMGSQTSWTWLSDWTELNWTELSEVILHLQFQFAFPPALITLTMTGLLLTSYSFSTQRLEWPFYKEMSRNERWYMHWFSIYSDSLVVQMTQNPAMQEISVWTLGQEDFLEKGIATHSSILGKFQAWRIPWTEEPGGLQSMRSIRKESDVTKWLSLSLHFQHALF